MADFLAGYISGAVGIIIGNPLDVVKTRLQASSKPSQPALSPSHTDGAASRRSSSTSTSPSEAQPQQARLTRRDALRGLAAPILTYGALNAVLFATYNRSLALLNAPAGLYGHTEAILLAKEGPEAPYPYWTHFAAGCLAGLATFVISAPTEVVKCRAQVVREMLLPNPPLHSSNTTRLATERVGSWAVAKDIWHNSGLKGFYHGGVITSARDAIGYGFYYLSYEWSKDLWDKHAGQDGGSGSGNEAAKVLLCGGIAGVATWASIFPLDVVKTRVQTQIVAVTPERSPLLGQQAGYARPLGAWQIAKQAYRAEGVQVFFRGIGVCCARAFIVNAVQWGVYEWVMAMMT